MEGSQKGEQHEFLALRVDLIRATIGGDAMPMSKVAIWTTTDTAKGVFSMARSEVAGG